MLEHLASSMWLETVVPMYEITLQTWAPYPSADCSVHLHAGFLILDRCM